LAIELAQNHVVWRFDLYVAGETPKSLYVYANLKKLCDGHMQKCVITVYNLLKEPKLAFDNQITATPALIRRSPLPEKILIGDLSNTETVISKLGLK
jgi:circadian clock protein KaiB